MNAFRWEIVYLAEKVAKSMSCTFPGINTDPHTLSAPHYSSFPTFCGSLRNALAVARKEAAAVTCNARMQRDIMSDHEVGNFAAWMQVLKKREMIIVRKYFSANGGLIAQISADEGSVCQQQGMDGLNDHINSRECGNGGRAGQDRRKDFDTIEQFTRLNTWFKLVAGEGMDQNARKRREILCFTWARGLIPIRGRKCFDELLKKKKLAGELLPASTLAGYDITMNVDRLMARNYEANSKQGRKTVPITLRGVGSPYFSGRTQI